jgi:thiol-disulfide isomerase/thioredoxin
MAAAAAASLGAGWLAYSAWSSGRGSPDVALGALFAAPALAASYPKRELHGAKPWLNTAPLRAEDLKGKVVLVNFWTYSCINSLRPLPYVRAWAEKYKDRGLVVIGVHTPEFGFEKDLANVRTANAALGVDYPVVLDSDYAIWNAFGNQAWPGFYFIGADGRVRRQKLGEGDYDESERLIQKLLAEARRSPVSDSIAPIPGSGPQAAPDWEHIASPETYVGHDKARGFVSTPAIRKDHAVLYQPPGGLPLNHWSLTGVWRVGGEFATLEGATGAIAYRFHARDLNFVLAPPADGRTIRFRVRIDGAAPGADHGFDTDAEGSGQIVEPRMYQLVRQSRPVADRSFEIEFLDPGVRAYVLTFG